MINLTIDGHAVTVQAGATVLEAARQAGIGIPTICDHKDLSPYGACRMCIVEIENVRGFPTSCTTPATEGMQVRTQSEQLATLRQRTLEMMLSGHPNSCLVCPHRTQCETLRPTASKAGQSTRCGSCSNRSECDLRSMALAMPQGDLNLPTLHAAHKVERDDPFMDRDYNLCILCARCWRICEKIHGQPAISIVNRGRLARVGTAFGKSHVHSGCTFCGSCIDICPTGALTDRFARWYGKPDAAASSVCTMCANGCALRLKAESGQLVTATMTAFEPEASLCALGRFGTAQIVNSPARLLRPAVRDHKALVSVDWDTALEVAAEGLRRHAGGLGVVISASATREEHFLYQKLAEALNGRFAVIAATSGQTPGQNPGQTPGQTPGMGPPWLTDPRSKPCTALLLAGNFLRPEELDTEGGGVEFLVVVDGLSAAIQERADVLLPAALLSERAGTFRDASSRVGEATAISRAPGLARPEVDILLALGSKLDLPGLGFASLAEVTQALDNDPPPPAHAGSPRHNAQEVPAFFRGHMVADIVPALHAFGLPCSGLPEPTKPQAGQGFELVERRELVPNMHLLRIRAPQVASHAKPGQFVILMAKETSERAPFTLADWDARQGEITVIIEEVGRSSRELVSLAQGARLAHVSGPLGAAFPVSRLGTVVLGGGCYGIGAILPLARALRQAGNRVICVIEAAGAHLLYWEQELRAECDELRIATKDGSRGTHGGVQEVFTHLHAHEGPVDMFIAIGCTFMMRMVSELTRPWRVPTQVALNPIMVDGTGMCGACRVSIHDQTRFACIDGPFFDAHGVDWDELACRRAAYAREEVEALPQNVDLNTLMFSQNARQGCGCGGR